MSGWHYPDDSHRGPWDGPSYEPDRPDPSEFFYGEGDDTDQHEPSLDLIHDPGFQEDDMDTHHDPDHGREEHRTGAILRQGEQWGEHYDDYDHAAGDQEHQRDTEDALPEHHGSIDAEFRSPLD